MRGLPAIRDSLPTSDDAGARCSVDVHIRGVADLDGLQRPLSLEAREHLHVTGEQPHRHTQPGGWVSGVVSLLESGDPFSPVWGLSGLGVSVGG